MVKSYMVVFIGGIVNAEYDNWFNYQFAFIVNPSALSQIGCKAPAWTNDITYGFSN